MLTTDVVWKMFIFIAVLYFSRSQAKMGILEFSDNLQL